MSKAEEEQRITPEASRNVLAIGAHPDDIEYFIGGTLILLKKAGYEITMASVTRGECGTETMPAEKIVRIRDKEARNAAKVIGATYENLGLQDGLVEVNGDNVKKVVKLMRETNPLIVFTHPLIDYMADHEHTARLVLWAAPESTHKNFPVETEAPALKGFPHIYHYDPEDLKASDGEIASVKTIIDISGVIEQKLEAVTQHKSQLSFQREDEPTIVVTTKEFAVIRGKELGVSYGEGFNQVFLAGYPENNILAEILGNKLVRTP